MSKTIALTSSKGPDELEVVNYPLEFAGLPIEITDLRRDLTLARVVYPKAAAKFLGRSEATLERMRLHQRGPPRVRLSTRRVGYRIIDLTRFVGANLVEPGDRRG